jgi:SET domain-containing protein
MTISASLGYIKDTGTSKGRGVFASRAITVDEVVEVCPTIIVRKPQIQLPPRLRSYVFNWTHLGGQPGLIAIALGYGSMYNHDNPANMRYEAVTESGCMSFVAIRDIAADEELTINYNGVNGDNLSLKDTWFEAHGITPLDG